MSGRTVLLLGGVLSAALVVGAIVYAGGDDQGNGPTGDTNLSTNEFHRKIAGPCNRMDIAVKALDKEEGVAKLGGKLRRFGRAVEEMLIGSRGLRAPQSVQDEFARYLTMLDDVYRATKAVFGKLPEKLGPLVDVVENVAKAKLRAHDAATEAGLPRTCALGTEEEALYLIYYAKANEACASVSKDLDKALPSGVPTTPGEVERNYRLSARYSRKLADKLRAVAPKRLPLKKGEQLADRFDDFAEAFDDGIAAVQALDVNALDRAVKALDPIQKKAEKLAKSLDLPACEGAL